MPLFLPKRSVLNWYQYDFVFSAELMQSFVEGIEEQAAEAITYFEQKKQIIGDDATDTARIVYRGLDDATWDLSSIFHEYFPSLQRCSALVTLCGYFEHEFESLCFLYQSEKSYGLAPSDLSGKGIFRSKEYLKKLAKLEVHEQSKEWNDIMEIQALRNAIVHNQGKIQKSTAKSIARLMKKVPTVRSIDDGEIVLDKGFLSFVLQTYLSYFKLIAESLNASQQA